MAITKRPPNTIYLGGGDGPGGESGCTVINDYVAIESITPGMLLEYHNDSGTLKWGVHDAAADQGSVVVALDQTLLNLGVDDAYAAGDLVMAGALRPGATFWGIIPSGQNISPAGKLQSNGDGKLKAATADTADANVARFVALESSGGAVTADTRIRVEVL